VTFQNAHIERLVSSSRYAAKLHAHDYRFACYIRACTYRRKLASFFFEEGEKERWKKVGKISNLTSCHMHNRER